MRERTVLLLVAIAGLGALTGYALWEHGLVGFIDSELANSATIASLADMTVALTLVAVWMLRDARDRGISAVPFVVLTVALGSIGPMLYLLRREVAAPAMGRALPHAARAS